MSELVLEKKKNDENLQYECACCKSIVDRRDTPSVGNLCEDCYKHQQGCLTELYHHIECRLSQLLQPETMLKKESVTSIRNDLRNIMREMGWTATF